MNANNQTTTSVKQIRLQVPITNLEPFAKSINELNEMYPQEKKKNEEKE